MNTDTPTTDQWETYCDECYYYMWRLRRKNERGFNDGFHINKGGEAKALCDLLNNLERERDEARGQANDMREKWLAKGLCCEHLGAELHDAICQRDEAREANKERDDLQKAVNGLCEHFGVSPANTTLLAVEVLKIQRERDELRRWTSVNGVIELQRERDEARAEMIRWMSIAEGRGRTDDDDTGKAMANLIRERDEARRQRDRLAAALRECREDSVELLDERDWWQHEPRGGYQQRYQETRHNVKRADAALQSLTTNEL